MKKVVILVILMSVIACNQKNNTENENNEKEKIINSLLNKMYYAYSHEALNDTLIFSKEVVELNNQCDSISIVDAKRIANSNNPTDKPILREGSLVSSLYEGVTDFKINEIKTVNGKTEVTVTLSNKHYPTLEQWNEKIILIAQNGLKIDDIYFDEDMTLKKSLINFIKLND